MSNKSESVIELEAKDNVGHKRKVKLRATAIDPITKREEDGPVTSSAVEDEFKNFSLSRHGVIDPPYPLSRFISLKEESTELGQCIQSMITNTVGFGWTLRERPIPEGLREKFQDEIMLERLTLLTRFEAVHPTYSFTDLRERAKDDQHSCGNGYIELIENRSEELSALGHVPGHLVRITKLSPKPIKISVPRVRPDKDFQIENVDMWHRFRKFGVVRLNKIVWFKEAGDPRFLDRETGEYSDNVPFAKRASSLIHFGNYSAKSPYGVPLWIGNLFSVYGSRSAEEINYNTLATNNIPSMFVIVENGALTESSIDRLREWTEAQIQNAANYSKFLLLEGDTIEDGAPNPTQFKIRVEPLKSLQQDDQLFQQYDHNNREKLRQAFRLPGIFVGRTDSYNRATADTSRDIADEQVFAPERARDDHKINRFIMLRWGARFHTFRSNHPNITDDIELIRLMAIAERSGAMTPRRADRIVKDVFGDDIGPMPKGIDLDRPFSVTFAEAQGGGGSGGDSKSPDGTANRLVDGLMKIRTQIEKELDSRYFDIDENEDL